MPGDASVEQFVSEDELNHFIKLFRIFEGELAPTSVQSREAEWEFNSLVKQIYWDRIEPKFGTEITSTLFRSAVRKRCRLRIARDLPPFSCP